MAERLRLRADFDIKGYLAARPGHFEGPERYGMIVADNGGNWRIAVVPDSRIKGLEELKKLKGSDFEVVETTGPDEGPCAKK